MTAAHTTDVSQSYDFAVERVVQNGTGRPDHGQYAPLIAGGNLHEQTATECSVTNLRVGARYLVSPFALRSFQSYYTGVWQVNGERVELVRMYGDRTFDERLAQVTTVDEAITLVTTGSLPDAATWPTASPVPDPPFGLWQALTAAMLAAIGVLAIRRRPTS